MLVIFIKDVSYAYRLNWLPCNLSCYSKVLCEFLQYFWVKNFLMLPCFLDRDRKGFDNPKLIVEEIWRFSIFSKNAKNFRAVERCWNRENQSCKKSKRHKVWSLVIEFVVLKLESGLKSIWYLKIKVTSRLAILCQKCNEDMKVLKKEFLKLWNCHKPISCFCDWFSVVLLCFVFLLFLVSGKNERSITKPF